MFGTPNPTLNFSQNKTHGTTKDGLDDKQKIGIKRRPAYNLCFIFIFIALLFSGLIVTIITLSTSTNDTSHTFPLNSSDSLSVSYWNDSLEIEVYSVGGRLGPNIHPEPYKSTIINLNAFQHNTSHGRILSNIITNDYCFTYSWHLVIPTDEQTGFRNTTINKIVQCGSSVTIKFQDPGTYVLSVTDISEKRMYNNITLRNIYVRRELRELTSDEWLNYVDAVWTLRNISTAVGRQRFMCPSGNQLDYKEYDFFVLFHAFHSANKICDQLHFSMMQEFAHEAWNTLFERALQCVHPSTTLHYWNEMKDSTMLGFKSDMLLNSSVWNSTMYGSAVDDIDGAAYVNDGAFAYFPIRNNRTGLCEYLDNEYHQLCNIFINDPYFWKGNKTHTGFFPQSPRSIDDFAFVSRRTGYLFGEQDNITLHTFPDETKIENEIMNKPLSQALEYITGDEVHGHAHYWISGLWGNMSVKETLKSNLIQNNIDLFRLFIWPLDARGRADGCITCNSWECVCSENSNERGCWNDNISQPVDSFDVQWHGYDNRSWWYKWLQKSRNLVPRNQQYGCGMLRGGTFDRSAVANADPTFYIHHAFTFWLVDRAKRNSTDIPPYYNLENYSKYECPGHRLDDETVFSNIVPYTNDQIIGQKHTWRDILFMWSDERHTARWE